MPYRRAPAKNVKVMPLQLLPGVFAHCQPEIGTIYDAEYVEPPGKCKSFCVINVNGMSIIMRKGEFAIIGG